jgi:hypothetical protein
MKWYSSCKHEQNILTCTYNYILIGAIFNKQQITLKHDFFCGSEATVGLGHLIVEISGSHSDTLRSVDSYARVINPKTQHSQKTDIHTPVGFEPAIQASERPQIHASDYAATGIGMPNIN